MQIVVKKNSIRVQFIDQETGTSKEIWVGYDAHENLELGDSTGRRIKMSFSSAKALAAALLLLEV